MGQEHKEYTWSLIAKKLNGEATPEELRELEHLLRCNPELHYPVQTVTDLWSSSNLHDQQEAEAAFNRHVERMRDLRIDSFTIQSNDNSIGQVTGGQAVAAPAGDVWMHDVAAANPDPLSGEKTHRGVRKLRADWLMAACLGGLVVATVVLWVRNSRQQGAKPIAATVANVPAFSGNEIFTGTGSRTHVSLPDGSVVWLNAGSRIKYEKNYGVNDREVSLTGEAFFDVAPNAAKPFVIHAARIDIRVLGTSFNVKSYPTDKTTETTLIKGSIEVSIRNRPRGQGKIILKPNEKLVVSNEDSAISQPVQGERSLNPARALVSIGKPTYEPSSGSIVETSWIDNKLIFQDEEFGELARLMERWYGVTIIFDNTRLQTLRFTGIFEKETVQQALEALTMTADFSYSIDGAQITIRDK